MKKYSKCIIQVMIIIDVDAEEKTMNLYHRFMNHIVNMYHGNKIPKNMVLPY